MAEAILYGIAVEVLNNLGSTALNKFASTWGFKDGLNELKTTVNTIKNVVLDAEERQVDSRAVRSWLERLSTAVYAADDLFDEFNTIASRKQLLSGNKVTNEVKAFFSHSNQIVFAHKISRKIKSIKEELEVIFEDGKLFNLAQRALDQGRVVTGTRDQSYSYVDVEEVIGRDDDKNAILELLLASDSAENEHEQEVLAVLPIVGIGGMGKTTLAQLIYNDPQVQRCFELRLWVCVAEDFDIKVITEKILRSATHTETSKLDMDQIQYQLREKINGRKYLLILDDVWEENPNKWDELRALLKNGRKGSKIIVTTRSRKVADIMRTFPSHELQGLSEEKSWALFEKMAFKTGEAQQKPHLVKIGKEIVKKCANVPLAIKTLGGLLRCEDESKWLTFKDKNLDEVMDVLKLSYQHLRSPLKNCFAYCALFPKDYVFQKKELIELWMAEGFIPCVNKGQNLEVAEDYFLNLVQRGFFQDTKRDEWGDISSCKMHDLMHDLAQQVAEAKCNIAKFDFKDHLSYAFDFKDTIFHLSFIPPLPPSWEIPNKMVNLKLLRSVLNVEIFSSGPRFSESTCQKVVTTFHHLRVLDLRYFKCKSFTSSIGKVIHLRYLNLSFSRIRTLPDSITNLYNLQTLNLRCCRELKTLPKQIHKLVNLMNLDIHGCDMLTYMPSGIRGLTLLCNLSFFIVSHKQYAELPKKLTNTAKLSDLKKLNNLRGKLSIRIHSDSGNNTLESMEADITNKPRLIELNVLFKLKTTSKTEKKKHDEAVLEGLRPHYNLRKLEIEYYRGETWPSWAVMDNLGRTLPNLVQITLYCCSNCKQVPAFSQLRFLKKLQLFHMKSLVYMESEVENNSPSSKTQVTENIFFPSLEELVLYDMKELKGWWKEVSEATTHNCDIKGKIASREQHGHHLLSLQFIKLSNLDVSQCPNLMFMPMCPNLENLSLEETNKSLSLVIMAPTSISTSTSLFPLPPSRGSSFNLKSVVIDDVEALISLSQLGLSTLSSLDLKDKNMQNTERIGQVFATLSYLRALDFRECWSLRTISKGLEYLTALEDLSFSVCKQLEVSSTNEDEDLIPWTALNSSLRSLSMHSLPKVVSLPSGIQHLSNLRSLQLRNMMELRELPEWMRCLSSLEHLHLDGCSKLRYLPQGLLNLTSLKLLEIFECPELKERYRSQVGTEWPNIQHIPRVYISN